MNQQYPPFENNVSGKMGQTPFNPATSTDPMRDAAARPVAVVQMPQTAWKSAPTAVRFAVWVWAISVIAGLALAAVFMVLFAIGMNLAILGGN